MLTAIKEAGTKDGKAIIEKLRSMEFSGAVGKIKFDAKGDITIAPYVVWITKTGNLRNTGNCKHGFQCLISTIKGFNS